MSAGSQFRSRCRCKAVWRKRRSPELSKRAWRKGQRVFSSLFPPEAIPSKFWIEEHAAARRSHDRLIGLARFRQRIYASGVDRERLQCAALEARQKRAEHIAGFD